MKPKWFNILGYGYSMEFFFYEIIKIKLYLKFKVKKASEKIYENNSYGKLRFSIILIEKENF